jgi:hypothetical protein
VRFVPLWALVVVPPLGEALTAALREETFTAIPQSAQSSAKAEKRRTDVAQLGRMQAGMRSREVDGHGQPPTLLGGPLRPSRLCGASASVIVAGARLSSRIDATNARVGRGIWSCLALVGLILLVGRGGALPGAAHPLLSAEFDARTLPVAAAARLRAEGLPLGPGYTTYEWGGYLDFALPAYHPFIDSRSDAYPQHLLADYATIDALGASWRTLFFDQYGFRWALLPARAPLEQVLALSPGWRCAPEDHTGIAALCMRE